jgi:glycerol-3-phosphate dehydrogenase subunit C
MTGAITLRHRDAVLQSMDRCTKCGVCHAHCPVAAVTGAFPGPKYVGPQAQRFRIIDQTPESSPFLCSGCGVCASVCPNQVDISDIITVAKAETVARGGGISLGQRLLNRPELIGKLGGLFPWITNAVLNNAALRRFAESVFGIHRDAPLPAVRGPLFRRWLAKWAQADGPRISYFSGCAVVNYDSDVGIDTVRLLNHLGYRVDVPTDLCCSLPMLSSGEWAPARGRAQRLVEALLPAARASQSIIATSTSCGLTLRSKYTAYLSMTDAGTQAVAHAMVDACEFLLDNHRKDIARDAKPLPLRVLYHGPCQLRGHRMGQPAVDLLGLIPGIELTLSAADCCGIGGTYGYDRDKHHIAMAIGKTLVDQIDALKPDVVVCDSETCRWSIEAQTGVPSVHPVQLLMRAIDGDNNAVKKHASNRVQMSDYGYKQTLASRAGMSALPPEADIVRATHNVSSKRMPFADLWVLLAVLKCNTVGQRG